ncbi:MAG: DNA-binding protein [Desulfobacteraceae bacterium]|nr:MAG: DNA-binding protein [Desulfobacteraceae bacterium]
MEKEKTDEYVSAPLLSVAEAARELGVGKKIIYQLIENGEIRAVKPKTGKTVLIEKKSLDEFRAAGRLP